MARRERYKEIIPTFTINQLQFTFVYGADALRAFKEYYDWLPGGGYFEQDPNGHGAWSSVYPGIKKHFKPVARQLGMRHWEVSLFRLAFFGPHSPSQDDSVASSE